MAREGKGAGVTSFLGPGCFYSLDMFLFFPPQIPYYQFSLTQDGSCCSSPNLPPSLQSDQFPVASKYLPVYFLLVIMKIDRTCLYQLFVQKEIEFCMHIFSCHYTSISCKLVWKVKIPGGGSCCLSAGDLRPHTQISKHI